MPDTGEAIISIHQNYADAILAGTKTVELRRRFPVLSAGTRLWVYATRPTSAVVGYVTILDVHRATPETIWKRHRIGTGVDYAAFRDYFSGAPEAVAILLTSARRVRPIGLDGLRRIRDCFHPPQVLTHLTESEAEALRALAEK